MATDDTGEVHEIRKTGTIDCVQECSYSEDVGRVVESGPVEILEYVDGPEIKCLCGEEFEGMQGARRHIEKKRGIRA